jgi:hypothetical protein
MEQRGISKGTIIWALKYGEKIYADENLRKAIYRNKNRILIVIYAIKNANEVEIITTYWES